MLMLRRTLVLGKSIGPGSLKKGFRAAYYLAEHIIQRAAKKPEWAKALNIEEYQKVKYMYRRQDLIKMLEEDAVTVRAAINDKVGFAVLEGAGFQSKGGLKKAIERAKKRIKDPVKGVFDSANPKHGNPAGFFINRLGGEGKDWVSLQILRGKESIGKFSRRMETVAELKKFKGAFREDYSWLAKIPDHAKVFTFKTASLFLEEGVPNMIKKISSPMIEGKGTPISTFLNLRAMHEMGIKFADKSVKIYKLDHILNKKTSFQIDWLRRMYPEASLSDLINHTHSYKYAEAALNQAGFKIKKSFLHAASEEYRVAQEAWMSGASFGKEGEKAFIKRHGFVNPDYVFESGHDMYLLLEPIN
jgi:hypothetical protein